MSARHFLLLVGVCLIWGLNFIVAKWSLSGTPVIVEGFEGAPPLFFAFIRFALLYAVLGPFLRPIPKKMGLVIGAGLTMGAVQFALLFIGLRFATPSTVAIIVQLAVPFTTILSIIFLSEKVGWVRSIGMGLAFVGASLVVFKPAEFSFTLGLLAAVGGALAAGAGSIFVKRLDMPVMSVQAWIGLISWPPLLIASMIFESDQISASLAGGWWFFASLVFTVVAVNILGHGGFYFLLRRYDASLVAPLTLMAPLVGVILGVLVLGDPVTWQLVLGGALALAVVAVVAARRSRTLPPENVIQRPR